MHYFSELCSWHWRGFHSLLLFSRAPSSPSLLNWVEMSPLRKHSEETLGERLFPTQEPHPKHASVCLWNAARAPWSFSTLPEACAGQSAGTFGRRMQRHGLKLGMLSLGSIIAGTLMPQFLLCSWCQGFWLLPMGLSAEISDIRMSLTLRGGSLYPPPL